MKEGLNYCYNNGFEIEYVWSALDGPEYKESSDWIAIVARKSIGIKVIIVKLNLIDFVSRHCYNLPIIECLGRWGSP